MRIQSNLFRDEERDIQNATILFMSIAELGTEIRFELVDLMNFLCHEVMKITTLSQKSLSDNVRLNPYISIKTSSQLLLAIASCSSFSR